MARKHGAPDWSNVRGLGVLHRLDDMAELAARLGALHTYDRRGEVVYQTDFSTGLQSWGTHTSGTGAAVALDPTEFLTGGYSIKLTGGSDGSRYAYIGQTLAYGLDVPHGLEVAWQAAADVGSMQWFHSWYDGTTRWVYGAKVSPALTSLYVYTTGAVWTLVSDAIRISVSGSEFHHCKLVFNPLSQAYVRVLYNDREFDVSDQEPASEASAAGKFLEVTAWTYSAPGDNSVIRVDSVIVTQNEPL